MVHSIHVVDQKIIFKQLEEGEFEKINEALKVLEDKYEGDQVSEDELSNALQGFTGQSIELENNYNSWVSAFRNHYQPYLARGVYYFTLGREKRGTGKFKDLTNSQYEEMNLYFRKAMADFEKSISINPKLVHPYGFMVRIATITGEDETKDKLFARALKVNPYSLVVRTDYLDSLVPRWGGSIEAMNSFILSSRPYYQRNPRLKVLEGAVDKELGYQQMLEGNYSEAIDLLSKALQQGDDVTAYFLRGLVYDRIGKFQAALQDFDKAIALKPYYVSAIEARINCEIKSKDLEKALVDANRLIEIVPLNENYFDLRGFIHSLLGNYDKSVSDYEQASRLNPDNNNYKTNISVNRNMSSNKGKTGPVPIANSKKASNQSGIVSVSKLVSGKNLIALAASGEAADNWKSFGDAVIERDGEGNNIFVIRKGATFNKSVYLPDAEGWFAVLIGQASTERINSDGAITGLPNISGYLIFGDRIVTNLQGQQLLFSGAKRNAWHVLWGIFPVDKTINKITISLSQAERRGVPHDGSAARFKNVGIYLFRNESEAKAWVAGFQ
jgi:tetratricopeptide (TPR) repeat protein